MLRMIEEAANDDPVEIQNGFNAYDECSSISRELLSLLIDNDEKLHTCAM
jgi:hypothetical protein